MAITGYDQAEFFVRGLKANGKNFKGTAAEVKYRPLQTRYDFVRVGQGGYINDNFPAGSLQDRPDNGESCLLNCCREPYSKMKNRISRLLVVVLLALPLTAAAQIGDHRNDFCYWCKWWLTYSLMWASLRV